MANTNQLARILAAKEGISIAEATRRINLTFITITEALDIDKNNLVKINDFGSFKVKQRTGVCQGKPYSTTVVKFKPFKYLANRVK